MRSLLIIWRFPTVGAATFEELCWKRKLVVEVTDSFEQ